MSNFSERLSILTPEKRLYMLQTLPSHVADADQRDKLYHLLTDFEFMEAKAVEFGPQRLIEDYRLSNEDELRILEQALQREAHILAKEPKLLPSHLYNFLCIQEDEGSIVDPLLRRAELALNQGTWLRLLNRPVTGIGRRRLIRVLNHGAKINLFSWSPDGEMIATGGEDGVIQLWDVRTGFSRKTLKGHRGPVQALSWSRDATLLASGSQDHTVRLWETHSGTLLFALSGHTEGIIDLLWLPDNRRLISRAGFDDHTIRLWDTVGGKCVTILTDTRSISCSPDGIWLACESSAGDNVVKIWNLNNGEYAATLRDTTMPMAWSPDSQTLVARAGIEENLRIWNAQTWTARQIESAHSEHISTLAWSPEGTQLASGGKDGIIKIWDVITGTTLLILAGHWDDDPVLQVGDKQYSRTHPITGDWVNRDTSPEIYFLTWSQDGTRIISGSENRSVRVWDARTGEVQTVLKDCKFPRWSGDRLAVEGPDDTIRLWVPEMREMETALVAQTDEVRTMAWSPERKDLATFGQTHVSLWNLEPVHGQTAMKGHSSDITLVRYSPNETVIASTAMDGYIRLWDLVTGYPAGMLTAGKEDVGRSWAPVLAWSPDGQRIACSDSNYFVARIWDKQTHRFDILLEGHQDIVNALDWSPDGKTIATAGRDKSVRLWDPISGKEISTLEGHRDSIEALKWSPDGRILASAGQDKTICLWDCASYGLVQRLAGNQKPIERLEWSPDSKWLVSGGTNKEEPEARIWDLSTGKCLTILPGAFAPFVWSPDGDLLATRCFADTIVIWNAASGTPLTILAATFSGREALNDNSANRTRRQREKLTYELPETERQTIQFVLSSDVEDRILFAWSPDGVYLATSGPDQDIRLWDVHSSRELAAAFGASPIRRIQFSKNGKVLLAADNGRSTGNQVISYVLAPENLKVDTLVSKPPISQKRQGASRQQPEPPPRDALSDNDTTRPQQADLFFRKLSPILLTEFNSTPTRTWHYITNLAEIYIKDKEFAQAESIYQNIFPTLEDTLEPDHPMIAAWFNNLAHIRKAENRLKEAEEFFQQSLAILERKSGEAKNLISVLTSLSSVYENQDSYENAEPLLRRALAIQESLEQSDKSQTKSILTSLVAACWAQGKYDGLESLLERLLFLLEKSPNSDQFLLFWCLNLLGRTYQTQGKYDEAEAALKRSLTAIQDQSPHSPNTALALYYLGALHKEQNRPDLAIPLFRRSLTILQESDLEKSGNTKIFEEMRVYLTKKEGPRNRWIMSTLIWSVLFIPLVAYSLSLLPTSLSLSVSVDRLLLGALLLVWASTGWQATTGNTSENKDESFDLRIFTGMITLTISIGISIFLISDIGINRIGVISAGLAVGFIVGLAMRFVTGSITQNIMNMVRSLALGVGFVGAAIASSLVYAKLGGIAGLAVSAITFLIAFVIAFLIGVAVALLILGGGGLSATKGALLAGILSGIAAGLIRGITEGINTAILVGTAMTAALALTIQMKSDVVSNERFRFWMVLVLAICFLALIWIFWLKGWMVLKT